MNLSQTPKLGFSILSNFLNKELGTQHKSSCLLLTSSGRCSDGIGVVSILFVASFFFFFNFLIFFI